VAVVGALLVLAVDRDPGRVHVQHDPLRRIRSSDLTLPMSSRLMRAKPVKFSLGVDLRRVFITLKPARIKVS